MVNVGMSLFFLLHLAPKLNQFICLTSTQGPPLLEKYNGDRNTYFRSTIQYNDKEADSFAGFFIFPEFVSL